MISLSVFNLNIMHGRNSKSAIFPPRLNRRKIQNNLQKILDCIRKYNPDIITLQEVDEGSILSGSFNQFEYLATKLQYPYSYFAPSCSIRFFGRNIFVSGNAILSKYPLEKCEFYNFDFSFPTDRMGFIIVNTKLPDGKTVAIVSLHLVYLDWLKKNSRYYQLKLVEKVVSLRRSSAIIAGDFNCEYVDEDSPLRSFIDKLNFQVYEPYGKDLATHPSWSPRQRIDWIFGSQDIEFSIYKNLGIQISDHYPVFANISL